MGGNSTETVRAGAVTWRIRPYREGDIPAFSAIWTANFAAAGHDIAITESEIEADFGRPAFDRAKQVITAVAPAVEGDERIVGFGEVTIVDDPEAKERLYRLTAIVHPAFESFDLQLELGKRLIEICRLDAKTAPEGTRTGVRYGCSEQQLSQVALCEALGLPRIRFFWTMAVPLDDNLEEPAAVEGVTMRNYRVPDDNEGAMLAYNDSFSDHFDSHPTTAEKWAYRMTTPMVRPDLSWLAEVDGVPGEIAGFCICTIFSDENEALGKHEGWIDLLGTTRAWRRKGLGRSLVLHGLHSLKSAGMDTGMLGVDSDSPTGANRLYESVGFKVRDVWVSYGCPLDEVRD